MDHKNLFHTRMVDIMKGTMANVTVEAIMTCHINDKAVTLRNVLTNLCPDAMGSKSKVRYILDKMEKDSDPGFLMKELIPLFWMDSEVQKIPMKLMTRAINVKVSKEATYQDWKRTILYVTSNSLQM